MPALKALANKRTLQCLLRTCKDGGPVILWIPFHKVGAAIKKEQTLVDAQLDHFKQDNSYKMAARRLHLVQEGTWGGERLPLSAPWS